MEERAHHSAVLRVFAASPLCPPTTRAAVLSALPEGGPSAPPPLPRTDRDALLAAFRFLGEEPAEGGGGDAPWEARLASRYWAALNKEFALADTSRCHAGRLGLRWRSAAEVAAGLGQFTCGALGCGSVAGLHSYEVPFAYSEGGEAKSALVKLRVCGGCAALAFSRRPQGKGGGGGGADAQ